jgi:hypothetical protein
MPAGRSTPEPTSRWSVTFWAIVAPLPRMCTFEWHFGDFGG